MTADYAALEARVAELEHQLRNLLPAKIDAVSYGVSLVHEDTRAIRETLTHHGDQLGSIERRLDRHGEMLTEILRRLPDPDA
jgi:hypothetical protein